MDKELYFGVDVSKKTLDLAYYDGEMFGPGGEGFMRLNVAAPKSVIKQALQQLEEAVSQL